MQVMLDSTLDSLFARPGLATAGGWKKGEFRDWTMFFLVLSARSMHDMSCEFSCAVRMRRNNWWFASKINIVTI